LTREPIEAKAFHALGRGKWQVGGTLAG
jgi:hypothetical protein